MKKLLYAPLFAGGLALPAAWRSRLQVLTNFLSARRAGRDPFDGESADVPGDRFIQPPGDRTSRFALFCAVPVASFSVALLAYAYAGFFARYVIDDRCVAAELWEHGFFGAQRHWYLTWTGRYTLMLALSFVELTGPELLVLLLPLLALTLWLIGLTWTIFQFLPTADRLKHPWITSLLLAEVVIYTTLRSVPNLYQVLYWVGGMMTYLAPLILLTFYAGFIKHKLDREDQSRGALLLSAISALTIGGFSEVNLALQTSALFLLLVACLCGAPAGGWKRAALPLIAAGFVGSLLAVIFSLPAPGNALRQATYPPPPDLFPLVKDSLRQASSFVAAAPRVRLPLTMSVALLVPALLAFTSPAREPAQAANFGARRMARWLLLSFLAAFILVVCCFVPSRYAMSFVMPRTLVVPQFVLVCFTVCWGYVAGLALRQAFHWPGISRPPYTSRCLMIVICALLAFGPVTSAWLTFAALPQFRAHAAGWDAADRELRAARRRGVKRLVVGRGCEFADVEC